MGMFWCPRRGDQRPRSQRISFPKASRRAPCEENPARVSRTDPEKRQFGVFPFHGNCCLRHYSKQPRADTEEEERPALPDPQRSQGENREIAQSSAPQKRPARRSPHHTPQHRRESTRPRKQDRKRTSPDAAENRHQEGNAQGPSTVPEQRCQSTNAAAFRSFWQYAPRGRKFSGTKAHPEGTIPEE